MSRQQGAPAPVMRVASELADAADLRSAVSASLAGSPIDEGALRRDVWTLVETERAVGAAPAEIITTLTDLIDEAELGPTSMRQARLRQVILWCVEAYFGHLGGDLLQRDVDAVTSLPRPASNR